MIFNITSTAFSIDSATIYSNFPWKLCPPVNMFGVGVPYKKV